MAECDDGVEFYIEEGGELLILKAVEAEFIYCTAIKQKASLRVALTRQSPFALSESVRLGCGSNEFEISRALRLCSKDTITLYATNFRCFSLTVNLRSSNHSWLNPFGKHLTLHVSPKKAATPVAEGAAMYVHMYKYILFHRLAECGINTRLELNK